MTTTQTPNPETADTLTRAVDNINRLTGELAAARQQRDDAILACRTGGRTQVAIARLANVSQVYVSDLLRRNGMPGRASSMLIVNLRCDDCGTEFDPIDDTVDVNSDIILRAQANACGWRCDTHGDYCPDHA